MLIPVMGMVSTALQESLFSTKLKGHRAMAGNGDPAGLETHRRSAALPKHPLREWSGKWRRNLRKILSNISKSCQKKEGEGVRGLKGSSCVNQA